MARNKTRKTPGFSDFEMCNVDFSLEDRVVINTWLEETIIPFSDVVQDIVEKGFKLSISAAHGREVYTLSLTDKRPIMSNQKAPIYLLRHADLEKLLGVTYYFWTEQLNRGDNQVSSSTDDLAW